MAAKKGTSKNPKMPGFKSKKLTANQAGQVKGGLGTAGRKNIKFDGTPQ